jgi:predicted nucleic acid-binding protein
VRRIVIDASVVVKWVVPEPGTAEALALRRYRLAAPDLLCAEVANILCKKVSRRELLPEEADVAARLLSTVDIELLPLRPHLTAATALAVSLGHPAYDCFYLAAASALDVPCVTADDRLVRKLRQGSSGTWTGRLIPLAETGSLRESH